MKLTDEVFDALYSVPNLLIETSEIIRIRSLSKQEGDVITGKDI